MDANDGTIAQARANFARNDIGLANRSLTRRSMIGLMGATGVGFATGCQVEAEQQPVTGREDSDPTAIELPDYSNLPTENVRFRWVDSGGLKSVWERSVLEAFQEKYPNIETQYDGNGWDNVNTVVPLGIRNGSAHDVFALPQEVPASVAIKEGWVQPIDELIPDFDEWVSHFPQDALVPGVSVFDDRLYSWPLSSNRRLVFMQMFDTANMAAAGYDDPASQITSWDEMLAALTAVVGTGKAGLMIGGSNDLGQVLPYLATTAGWGAVTGGSMVSGLDFSTGQYKFSADEMVAAYELLEKMATDNLLVPGYLSLLAQDARSQVTAGGAGMILNGPWDIPAWKSKAPDWQYSIASLPTPSGELDYFVPFEEGSNASWAYSGTEVPEIVGAVYSYMGSVEGQKMMVILSEGNLRSLIPEANEAAAQAVELDEKAATANDLAAALMRQAPRPELRNPDVPMVTVELQKVSPNLNDIVQGLLVGDLSDARTEFAKYDDALDTALDQAIDAAQAKGATVTRDDFVFNNWSVDTDYTIDMYESA